MKLNFFFIRIVATNIELIWQWNLPIWFLLRLYIIFLINYLHSFFHTRESFGLCVSGKSTMYYRRCYQVHSILSYATRNFTMLFRKLSLLFTDDLEATNSILPFSSWRSAVRCSFGSCASLSLCVHTQLTWNISIILVYSQWKLLNEQ